MGKFDKYWEMKEGGPYDQGEEVFKCTDCGAVTFPDKGFNGEPDTDQCTEKCKANSGDWKPGAVSDKYRRNLDEVFPAAPGAGI